MLESSRPHDWRLVQSKQREIDCFAGADYGSVWDLNIEERRYSIAHFVDWGHVLIGWSPAKLDA
jgi:hypothetical protein